MTNIVESIRGEFLRYKALAEGAIDQLSDSELSSPAPPGGNSIATIGWHVSGNLRSRFTDFLTSDGEKPWRRREEEFAERTVTRAGLLETWQHGWDALLQALEGLTDDRLADVVTIRGERFAVHAALHRSLAHTSYHVGQIVYAAKALRGSQWAYLSIPPGGSDAYNRNPRFERPAAHAAGVADRFGSSTDRSR